MGSYKIKRLNLSQNMIDILEKQNLISCKDVLSLTKPELQSLLGLTHKKLENLLNEICKKCLTEPKTAYEIFVHQESTKTNGFLSLSLHTLDLLLQGGLPLGSLTEIAGPPGVGKTQFCFMLSILAALPPPVGCLDGQVIYIDTESAFSAERLKTIAQKRFPQYFKQNEKLNSVLKRILVHKVHSVNDLKEITSQLEKEIIRNEVKLVILDSVASLMRKEFGTEDFQSLLERNKTLVEQAASLKELAQTYKIVVFLTNQITSQQMELEPVLSEDAILENEDTVHSRGFAGCSTVAAARKDGEHVVPALGNTWSHCVNTRLVAQFVDGDVRQLTIAKSPVAPNASVKYILNDSGVSLLDDDIEFLSVPSRVHQSIQTKYNFLSDDDFKGTNAFSGIEDNL